MSSPETPGDNGEKLPAMELAEQSLVKPNQFQSLFLTNGQVYFGSLWIYDTGYLLTNIYYLQTERDAEGAPVKDDDGADKMQIVKLGNELHGPEDSTFYNRHAVMSWQNLKDDSKVSETINDYIENGPTDL